MNLDHLSRLDLSQRVENPRQERTQIDETIPYAADHNDRDSERVDVLLEPHVAVRGEQDLETGLGGSTQQDAVSQAGPSLRTHGYRVVTH